MLDGSSRHTLLLLGRLLTRARAPVPRRRLTDLTGVARPHAHHTRVDGCQKFLQVSAIDSHCIQVAVYRILCQSHRLALNFIEAAMYCIEYCMRICTAGNAVLHLHVQLRQRVGFEHTGIPHVALATSLDDVAHLDNHAKPHS